MPVLFTKSGQKTPILPSRFCKTLFGVQKWQISEGKLWSLYMRFFTKRVQNGQKMQLVPSQLADPQNRYDGMREKVVNNRRTKCGIFFRFCRKIRLFESARSPSHFFWGTWTSANLQARTGKNTAFLGKMTGPFLGRFCHSCPEKADFDGFLPEK